MCAFPIVEVVNIEEFKEILKGEVQKRADLK